MSKTETISSYLTQISHVRDEHVAVGEIVLDSKLIRIALSRFIEWWDTFIKRVVAWKHFPTWDRLWDDFTQEETRAEALHGS